MTTWPVWLLIVTHAAAFTAGGCIGMVLMSLFAHREFAKAIRRGEEY
jgi:hypothetical protein